VATAISPELAPKVLLKLYQIAMLATTAINQAILPEIAPNKKAKVKEETTTELL
jgi:hypothetical protein